MSNQKEIRIFTKNGLVLRVPKHIVQKVVVPGVIIRNNYFRLVLEMQNYEKSLEKIRRIYERI